MPHTICRGAAAAPDGPGYESTGERLSPEAIKASTEMRLAVSVGGENSAQPRQHDSGFDNSTALAVQAMYGSTREKTPHLRTTLASRAR